MPTPQELLSDFQTLPPEEKVRAFADPSIAAVIRNALEADIDYQNLPESDKGKAREYLGFPSLAPVTSVFVDRPLKPEIVSQMSGFGEPIKPISWSDFYRDVFSGPIRETLSRESALLETPFGTIDIGTKGGAGRFVRAPLRSLGGRPFGLIPEHIPEPSFLSFENAATVATDALLLAPLFTMKAVSTAVKPAKEFFQFFVRYPGIAHAVANASIQGGVLAAVNTFSHKVGELIQQGQITTEKLATEFGKEFANSAAILLGFHGAIKFGVGTAEAIGKGAIKVGEHIPVVGDFIRGWRSADEFAKLSREAQKSVMESMSNVVESVAQDIGESAASVAPVAGALVPSVSVPLPRGGSILDLAKAAITPESRPTQQLLKRAEEALFPAKKPGFLLSAEERVRGYPRSSQVVDDVLSPTMTQIAPSGKIIASIPENVIKSGFVAERDAMVGDMIYESGRIVKVVDRLAKGLRVLPEKGGPYFVPFARVTGRIESRFSVGEQVFMSSGEPVIVESILNKDMLRVVNSKGTKFAISESKLSTEAERLSSAENAERAAMGIDGPAPSGNSVWEIIEDLSKGISTSEAGYFIPGKKFPGSLFGSGRTSKNSVPVHAYTQPDPTDFGAYRYYIPIPVTLLLKNLPQYTNLARLAYDAKIAETVINHGTDNLIRGFKKLVGSDDAVSKKLTRFLIGLPNVGEKLTRSQRSVVDSINKWAQANIIPIINQQRSTANQPPVPPNYNYAFQLFPEVLMTAGSRAKGLARMFGDFIQPTGVENFVRFPWGSNVRLEVEANVWKLFKEMSDFVIHEKAWRVPIQYTKILAGAEKSPSNKKLLSWYARHLEGRQAAPDIGDISGFAHRVDQMFADRFGLKGTATFVTSTGERVPIIIPGLSLADKNLNSLVLSAKTLGYANMIGFNIRTIILNLSQPVTDGLAHIPGSPISAVFDLALGYTKSLSPLVSRLWNKEALRHYRDLGVLHDMEELFMPIGITKTTGRFGKDAAYAGSWMWNNLVSMSFIGMRMAELVNRVTVYEAHKAASQRLAKEFAGGNKQLLQAVNSPDFQEALSRMGVYASNISNFLYGKGFKAPIQAGYVPGTSAIGETLYMFNTFAINHMANMGLLWNQQFKGHMNAAARMAAIGAPKEFAQYLSYIEPTQRRAFLKALVYQTALAQFFSSGLGLAAIASQVSSRGMLAINPDTPMIQMTMDLAREFFQGDLYGIGTVLYKKLRPGMTAQRRYERGGPSIEGFVLTESEMKGKPSKFEPPTLYESVFGREARPGALRAP